MVAQKGRDLLLKVLDTGTTFTTLGGLRKTELKLGAETVDVTDVESSGQARELLEAGGVISASVSGSGIFKDDAMFAKAHTYYTAQSLKTYKIIIPSYGTFEGLFQITELALDGEYNGTVQYNISLESSGVIAFTAA